MCKRNIIEGFKDFDQEGVFSVLFRYFFCVTVFLSLTIWGLLYFLLFFITIFPKINVEASRGCGSNRSVTGRVNLSVFGTFVVLVSLSITMHPIRFDGDSCLKPGSLQAFPPSVLDSLEKPVG